MTPDSQLEEAFDSVADGIAVDWSVLQLDAADQDERELLEQLRIVDALASVHRRSDPVAQPELAPPLLDPLPRRWGHYDLVERLGSGTFGTVYKAWDSQLKRHIALKLLHPHEDVQGTIRDRVLREGSAIASVSHQNVVMVFGVEVHDGRVGLCMQLVKGRTLDDIVRTQGTLGEHESAMVGQAVCRALAAVHAAGLVHQDVKTRNVMREDGGRIVLMDFGTGHVLTGDDAAGGTAGTPIYMAPEAFAGAPPSVAMDVYSTGVLLFHLVSGRYPYEGDTIDDVVRAHARGERHVVTEHRPDLSASFVRTIERALDPDPRRRHESAARLLLDLLNVDERPPVLPEPRRSLGSELWRYLFRDPVRFAALASGGLVLPMLMGLITSHAYTYALGLDGRFSDEGPVAWLRWGIKSLVAPLVLMIVVGTIMLMLSEVISLIRRMSSGGDSFMQRLCSTPVRLLGRVGLSSASTLADLVVLASLAFLGWVVFFRFAPLLVAVVTPVHEASPGVLARLSPANEAEHAAYRQLLSVAVLLMVFGWAAVVRLASRRGEHIRPLLAGGGFATIALTLLLLDMPYRLLWQNEHERAVYKGATCYVIGSNGGVVRLFCPRSTPRGVTARDGDPDLERTGVSENIFTGL
jgi:serine/threonine protein kinase